MKLLRKITYLMLVLTMVLTLAACGGNTTPTTEEPKPEEPAAAGAIAKLGLGKVVSLAKSSEIGEEGGSAQEDTTVVAAGFDADGKIVSVTIDVAQNKAKFEAGGALGFDAAASGKSKKELGADYDMLKASKIGKEWFEQAEALEAYWIGKTADEVMNMEVTERDAAHKAVPASADLTSSVTITIDGYQQALKDAWDNAVDVAAPATKVGLGLVSGYGRGTKAAEGENGASAQFETYMSAVAVDDEGKVAEVLIDTAQNTVAYGADGKLSPEFKPEGTTKKVLKDDYDMRKASGIGKEWFEQIEAFEDHLIGKTAEEISGLTLEEGKPVDLASSVTISVGGYQTVVGEAITNAK